MSDAIQFTNIPGTGLVAPIFTSEFNSGGQYTSVDRLILVGHKTATTNWPLYTPTPISSLQQAEALAGPKSQLREMARLALANAPTAPVWIMAVADSALTANVRTLTLVAPAVGTGRLEIMDETIQIAVGSTDTATTVAAALAAAIGGYRNALTGAQIPFSATSAAGVVTLTASNKGAMFNEIDIYIPYDSSNVFAPAGVLTVAVTTAGAGTPTDIATALAALGDNPADFVVCPWSDSTSLSSYSAWSNDVSGRWAWSRQSYGHIWSAGVNNFAGLTTTGLGLNDRHLTMVGCVTPGASGSPHPSYLWSSAITARLFPYLTDIAYGNISVAHKGLSLIGIGAPRDPSVWPNYNGRNTLNQSGISTWEVAADGTVQISKIVTTYQTGAAGQPDAVFRDIQAVYQCSEGMKYMRAELGAMFSQKAIANANPGSLGAMVTPADMKAAIVGIYSDLCARGVYQDADTFAKLIVVRINPTNPNRFDVFCPMERVNPLDILAINATIYQQFPNVSLLPQAA